MLIRERPTRGRAGKQLLGIDAAAMQSVEALSQFADEVVAVPDHRFDAPCPEGKRLSMPVVDAADESSVVLSGGRP